MTIIFSLRKGKIGIMKNFMHATETLATAMNPLQKNRFKIEYKIRHYNNGRVVPEKTKLITSLSEAYSLN